MAAYSDAWSNQFGQEPNFRGAQLRDDADRFDWTFRNFPNAGTPTMANSSYSTTPISSGVNPGGWNLGDNTAPMPNSRPETMGEFFSPGTNDKLNSLFGGKSTETLPGQIARGITGAGGNNGMGAVIAQYFIRAIVVILGMIFVAVGLGLFSQNKVAQVIRAAGR